MADPKYIEQKMIALEAKIDKLGETYRIYSLVDKKRFESLSEEQQKAVLLKELSKSSHKPASGILNLNLGFSYGDKDVLKGFDYGNVFIEAHIPYCLAIPNGYELEIFNKSPDESVLLTPLKVWTNKAMTNTEISDEIDFFAEDKVMYFRDSVTLTPAIPLNPKEGWAPNFTGTNLQRIKDREGVFRYTRMYIQLNHQVNKEDIDDKERCKKMLEDLHSKALNGVNKLIDAYRIRTNEEYISRLPKLSINMVYFLEIDEGIQLLSPNIETAIMNRSKQELDDIQNLLISGESPELYKLLLLDAENSSNNNDNALAIVQSFQALEIFLENFLILELINRKGYDEQDAISYLGKGENWKTKTRLKNVLNDATGYTLERKDKALWDRWCTSYDTVRNKVIHKGKEASAVEVKQSLICNKEVIDLIKQL